MKKTIACFIFIVLSSSIYVKAQDSTITGIVLSSDGSFLPEASIALKGDSTYHTKPDIILTKSNREPNEVVQVLYGTRNRAIVLPVEIPNAYKRDNSIEMPNAYNRNKDESIEIPNTDSNDQGMSFIRQK